MNLFAQPFGLIIGGALLCASAALAADAAAPAAAYESGLDVAPLRRLEQQIRDAASDSGRRAACEAELLSLLAPGSSFEAKRFACAGLSVVGTDASLPALEALLQAEDTAGIACLALGGLRTEQAGSLLRAALAAARGPARLPLVSALGARAEAASVGALAALARDADGAVAGAAVRALGAIDAAPAREAVEALRREASPALAAAVGAASLCGAEQRLAAGDRAAAAAVCEELLKPSWPAHVRRGALGLLLRSDGDQGARRARSVLSAAAPDPVLTAVAIARVPELRGEGVSKAFGELLPRLPAAEQVLLVEALAARGDADARAVLRAQVSSAATPVRCAALGAVGALDGAAAAGLLVKALASPTPDEQQAAQAALVGLGGGEAADSALIAAARQAEGKDKLALLAVLSQRGGRLGAAELLAVACAPDEAAARAAAQGLVRIAGAGDAAALPVLQQAAANGETRAQEAALRTLAAWRGLAAWDTLAGVYLKAGDEAQHALALRGLVRAASEANAEPGAGLAGRYLQLLSGARGADERKLILRVLGGGASPETLKLALSLLDDPAVCAEAAEAVARLAKALEASHPEAARAALQRLQNRK